MGTLLSLHKLFLTFFLFKTFPYLTQFSYLVAGFVSLLVNVMENLCQSAVFPKYFCNTFSVPIWCTVKNVWVLCTTIFVLYTCFSRLWHMLHTVFLFSDYGSTFRILCYGFLGLIKIYVLLRKKKKLNFKLPLQGLSTEQKFHASYVASRHHVYFIVLKQCGIIRLHVTANDWHL
jgi:hypothetical protein